MLSLLHLVHELLQLSFNFPLPSSFPPRVLSFFQRVQFLQQNFPFPFRFLFLLAAVSDELFGHVRGKRGDTYDPDRADTKNRDPSRGGFE